MTADAHRLQTQAVDRALELAEADGTVHVFGAKESGAMLSALERACSSTDQGQRVIYHLNVVQLTGDCSWVCVDCGEPSETQQPEDNVTWSRLDS